MADRVNQQSSGVLNSIWEGAVEGDFSSDDSTTKKISQIVVGFIPGLGQIADARDTLAAIRDIRNGKGDGWAGLGLAAAGWIPLGGDLLKSTYKSGLRKTLGGIGDALGSVRERWRSLRALSPERQGQVGRIFYKPGLDTAALDLPRSIASSTNQWGDSKIAAFLTEKQAQEALGRESVLRALSPRLLLGQELRADLSSLGYAESHLLRRIEEGLAEGYGKFKSGGLRGFWEGWQAPLKDLDNLDPGRLAIEKHILLGLGTSSAGLGLALGELDNGDAKAR